MYYYSPMWRIFVHLCFDFEITENIKINSDLKAVKLNSEMWAPVNVFLLWESSHDF